MVYLVLAVVANCQFSQYQVVSAVDEAAILSKDLGVPVAVSHTLAKDRLLVVPHGAAPEAVLQATASALCATAVREKEGWFIERTKDDLDKMEAKLVEVREEWLKKVIQSSRAYRSAQLEHTSVAQAYDKAFKQHMRQVDSYFARKTTIVESSSPSDLMPSKALLESLCERVGLTNIAKLKGGDVYVFEDRPVSGAKALPPHEDLLEQYTTSMDKLGPLTLSPESQALLQRSIGLEKEDVRVWQIHDAPIDRLRLDIRVDWNTILIKLEGYDRLGNRILQTGMAAHNTEQLRAGTAIMSDDLKGEAGNAPELATLRPESLAAITHSRNQGDPLLPNWYTHPEITEPLDLFVRDALDRIAEETPAKCVVFTVSDSMWLYARGSFHDGHVRVGVMKQILAEFNPYERLEDSQTVVWRPQDIEFDERHNADRSELGRFARKVQVAKTVDLRSVALLYHEASPMVGPFASMWPLFASERLEVKPIWGLTMSDPWFKLLGAIDEDEWEKLASGQARTVSQLGVETEFNALLRSRENTVRGQSKFPEIYLHPAELYPDGQVGSTRISLAAVPCVITRAWDAKKPEPPGDPSDNSIWDIVTYISELNVRLGKGNPTVWLKRSDYDSRLDKLLFRRGTMITPRVSAALRADLELRAELSGTAVWDKESFSLTQWTQDQRDALWKSACDDAIARALKRQAQGQAPGSNVVPGAASPKTPPPSRR